MKWPQNQLANLCLTEVMINSPLFSYPFLNKYYCLGWNTSATNMQMGYDTATRACLAIYNMAKANKCLQELETRYNYDLEGTNVYKPVSDKKVQVADAEETIFSTSFAVD